MLSGRVVLIMQVYGKLQSGDAPEELSNMSMPFVMPISLVVTFLLQACNVNVSPGSPENNNKAAMETVRQACFLCLTDARDYERCRDHKGRL